VFFFDTDNSGFGSCWLVKKTLTEQSGIDEGAWDANHLVTTNVDQNQKAKYRLVSAVFLQINMKNEKQGQVSVAGHVSKLKEDIVTIDPKMDIQQFHIRNIGKLIESAESEIRSDMHGITINKAK